MISGENKDRPHHHNQPLASGFFHTETPPLGRASVFSLLLANNFYHPSQGSNFCYTSKMKPDPRLHHYCQSIAKGHLNDVVEMYTLLGFKVVYTPPGNAGWIMIGQEQLRFAIQIAEVADKPITDIHTKTQTHIAFISDNPQKVIDKIETWAKSKNLQFRKGGWSEKERYFDLPDIFINFVVEVMHTSIEKE